MVLPGLPAGDYVLIVEAADFSAYRATLTLAVGQMADVRVVMSVNPLKEQIDVRETTLGIDTQTSQASQVIEKRKIADLPISGRDFIDFALLTPSANVGRSTAVGAQSPFQETVLELSFGGLRETHSTFFGLDGMDYTTSISGVQRSSPSLDWVQEFRVSASPVTADNARNLGSVVNTVTKSGSNDVHGSAYEFFRNNQLDANNLLTAPGFNALRFNQFGANVGGPIRREKLFYFLGYEGQRRAESPLYSSFILHCTDHPGCLGPGTPSINQVKEMLGLQPENLGSFLQIQDYDNLCAIRRHTPTPFICSALIGPQKVSSTLGAEPSTSIPWVPGLSRRCWLPISLIPAGSRVAYIPIASSISRLQKISRTAGASIRSSSAGI